MDKKKELNKDEIFVQTGVVVPKTPRGTLENKLFDVKIDTWESLQVVKEKIKDLQTEINIKWFQMAKYVYIIWRDKAWELEGCKSWSEWVAENYEYLGRGLRQIERLIRVWKVLVIDLKQPVKEVAIMSATNAYEITRYAKPSNVKDLIDMGSGLETRALRKTLEQADMENLSSSQVFHCDHKETIILIKCKSCKEMFYRIPEKATTIIDKDEILDKKAVEKKNSICRVLKDSTIKQ